MQHISPFFAVAPFLRDAILTYLKSQLYSHSPVLETANYRITSETFNRMYLEYLNWQKGAHSCEVLCYLLIMLKFCCGAYIACYQLRKPGSVPNHSMKQLSLFLYSAQNARRHHCFSAITPKAECVTVVTTSSIFSADACF